MAIPRVQLAIAISIVVLALVIAGSLVLLVPVGEAPDEPAHLNYVDHLTRYGVLPQVSRAPVGFTYEYHQPPLAYVFMASVVRCAGFSSIGYDFVSDPAFEFQRGARALMEPVDSSASIRAIQAVRSARFANLLWLLVVEIAILFVCVRLASSFAFGIASAVPFCLAPQLLFTCSTANNDAAVIALSSVVVLGLVVHSSTDDEMPSAAAGVSIVAGLALWAKVTAFFLVPGLVFGAFVLARKRNWRSAISLLAPGLLIATAWLVLALSRTGAAVPLPANMAGNDPGGWLRLITQPSWSFSVWGGFWSKFGWVNLPLPIWAYVAFLPPTIAALLAFITPLFSRDSRGPTRLLLIITVLANLAVLVLFIVRVDWQPQGRYLLPSIVPLAGLCALGLSELVRRPSARTVSCLAIVSIVSSITVVAIAVAVVAVTY